MTQELQNEISFIDALCPHLEKIVEDEVESGTLTSSSTFRELAVYMVNARAPLDAFIKKFDTAKPSRIKRFTRSAPWRSRKEGLQDLLPHVREGFMKWLAPGDWDINYAEDVPENAETKAATNFLARKAFNDLRDSQGGELNPIPCGNMEEGNAVLSVDMQAKYSHSPEAKTIWDIFNTLSQRFEKIYIVMNATANVAADEIASSKYCKKLYTSAIYTALRSS
ncbi:hypothetical protein M422DRAFT_254777 [Sphaerobolus stellatus SS14]|uniref:Uncharacterized protein n=1 Tax=Sphaerobolus stellatus (strain SS14) TaxID=990650 RepID=A0A0C9VK93_SPHS4|nr:hypothetical protein M422DRAFT_254777 [Sphaerobolus stellatus SS14]